MKKITFLALAILLAATMLYSYSQFVKKSVISAVLQHQVDLSNPPEAIYAISTFDQTLPDGKSIPKGTRFMGKLSKENNSFIIYFDESQATDGKKTQLLAKSSLNIKEGESGKGVSAKISKTLYKQTKTNVLGAIFNTPTSSPNSNTILPRGYNLKIEVE